VFVEIFLFSVDFSLRNRIAIALVCQSNLNRSMEAHWELQESNIRAYSFGAGTKVRLPGETLQTPHVYEFGTPYDRMYKDLERKNRQRYSKNKMLQMLDRDRQLKEAPERWQDHYDRYANAEAEAHKRRKPVTDADADADHSASLSPSDPDPPPLPSHFDLVITYEKRVFDIVISDIETRSQSAQTSNRPVHIINLDTTDNHAEAAVSAALTVELVESIYAVADRAKTAGESNQGEEENDEDVDGQGWEDLIDDIIDAYSKKHNREILHSVLFY
jgi:RNA polymerase II subunit A C-terminal domain phosphatase SSU72